MLLLLLGLLGLLWGGTALLLRQTRAAAVEAALATAEAEAATAAETVLRAFEAVESLHDLVQMRQAMLRGGDAAGATAVEAHLAGIAERQRFGVVRVGVIGPDGMLRWSTGPAGAQGAVAEGPPPDWPSIRARADSGAPGLAISRPTRLTAGGDWSLQAARPLRSAEGRFDGLAVVTLDPVALSAQLQAHLQEDEEEQGRVVVVRHTEDGAIVLRGRSAADALSRRANPYHAVLAAARDAPVGSLAYVSRRTGRPRLVGYRVLPGLPLLASVVLDEERELAGWRDQRLAILAGAAALSLLLVTLLTLQQAWRRSRLAQQRQARQRILAAETLARQRAEILAVIAHEIRTPLTGLLGFGEMLAEADIPAEQRGHAALVVETGRMLLAVVNDTLDLARIEAGRISIEAQPFEPATLLRQCLALSEAPAAAKGLRLLLDLDPALPPWLSGDVTRIRQVLGNLLSNAVKFTERGGVTLRARVQDAPRPGLVGLRLEVQDTGIGIPIASQSRLFTLFEQAEGGRRFGGTGLGLAVSRRLMKAMGGRIGVRSEPGLGSIFWADLALPVAAAPAPAERGGAEPGPPLAILVVDDVAANRVLISAYLSAAGHAVTLASGGVEAVAIAERRRFDAIVMDVNMPGMDGLEATRRLRAGSGPNLRTPILALTAGATSDDRQRTQAAGMSLHLTKPVDRLMLLQVLRRLAVPVSPV
ncbi:hybrid sensor histidine kinase/response regulator [Paracraurococcus ruber]|uniref:histidine kinase n=1 Tax=Paracraurococcus ruber TaxID=77675 RepID=A0ABS1CWY7_9PROT|nr:ATP-binding protein [Paracraurococcus ruber]MBK1658831.1 hypothetical protein [Paracraurococcus ruber]TDG29758.1 hybrid sensor histidine kinase/response regulator [Paracraurococcus ruber]